MAYKDLVPVGTALIIASTSFGLGAVYANLPYDFYTLWTYDGEGFARSLAHYAAWGNAPMRVHHILHGVIAMGLIGCFIKLYKPHQDVIYFEYATLILMMVGVVIYLTNLRIGVQSAISGEWGEVEMSTGINVVAASQFMIVIALTGVLFLQAGLYYAEWYETKLQKEYLEQDTAAQAAAAQAGAAAAQVAAEKVETVGSKKTKATGAEPKKTRAKKRTA